MALMTGSDFGLPERSFDADGRRLSASWPAPQRPPGLEEVLARTPITFVSAAQWRWSEGHRVRNRRLPTTNLACYLRGTGTAWIAGTAWRIAPGTLILTPRGWAQRVEHDPGRPFEALSFHAQMPVHGGPADLLEALGAPQCIRLDRRLDAPVVTAMAAMARLDACRPPGWAEAARAHLLLLIHHLVERHAAAFLPPAGGQGGADAARLAPAFAHITARLGEGPVTLADLARALGLAPVSVRRLFRRATGLGPARFIQQQRVDLACRLLRASSEPVARIAAAVGCADGPVFHRLFRRLTGTTPEAWRRGP